MICTQCRLQYVESGDSEMPPEQGGGMIGFDKVGYGYHPVFGVCGLCFLHSMFGGMLEPWPDSKAIFGIGCSSERQQEPDWDRWEEDGYEPWPPQRPTDPDIEIPF